MYRCTTLFLLSFFRCMPYAFAAWTPIQFRDAMKAWAASDQLDDPNGKLRLWQDPHETVLCDFEGIDCDYYYDYYWIQSIDLDNLGLAGAIPPWMWAAAEISINLSNNQWYNTTAFYEDTSAGIGKDRTGNLISLNCSNCGFFLKSDDGTTILPEEWTRYHSLEHFDFSGNKGLIGQLPTSWLSAWPSLKSFVFIETSFCEPLLFVTDERLNVQGQIISSQECSELILNFPWELTPPDPPAYPSYYEVFQKVISVDKDMLTAVVDSDKALIALF